MFKVELSKNELIKVFPEHKITLKIKREDLIHPIISGNKYRKLKYNITAMQKQNKTALLTFGGAFSNHIAATAMAGKQYGIKTIGLIRGEELALKINTNPTLKLAQSCGMILKFISRSDYKTKDNSIFISKLKEQFGDFYLLPEGGTNALAIKGCEEILTKEDASYDYICTSVGTGGTISGLINAAKPTQQILGFSALKGDFLKKDISKFVKQDNWKLITEYHFGGYGKINTELITFINQFKKQYNIQLDPIYTGKMLYGIIDMITKKAFKKETTILAIHTGGIQGIKGINKKLLKQQLPLIE